MLFTTVACRLHFAKVKENQSKPASATPPPRHNKDVLDSLSGSCHVVALHLQSKATVAAKMFHTAKGSCATSLSFKWHF